MVWLQKECGWCAGGGSEGSVSSEGNEGSVGSVLGKRVQVMKGVKGV